MENALTTPTTSDVTVFPGNGPSTADTKIFDMASQAASPPWEPIPEATCIDDVVRNLDQVIEWSIKAKSTIGYFAALYKRTTVAIRKAINEGDFDDGRRMERLDVIFANRYFSALNAYFLPHEYGGLTLAWEVAFVGDKDRQATILQHLMTGMNAHITLDLGLAAFATAPYTLKSLEGDFNRVNAILASQVQGMLDIVQDRSPTLLWIRRLIPCEVFLIKRLLIRLREGAWHFAIYMAINSDNATEARVNQSAWTAAIGAWYLQPPGRWTPFPFLIRAIAKREKHNVRRTIRALGKKADSPDPMKKAYLMPHKKTLLR